MENPNNSFESALEKLQNTVKRLESGELSLDQALKSFEEGIGLARECQKQLTQAEQKVEVLMQQSEQGVELKPFNV